MVARWLPIALSAVVASAGGIIFKLIKGSTDAEANEDASGQQPAVVHKTGSLATTSADEISIVSYNILADVFSKKLTYADESLLDWREHRWPLIQQQIRAWSADIVCLQEVDVLWLSEYLAFAAAAGYSAIHQDSKGKQVVCMTLFKPGKLQLWWQESRSRALLAAFLFTDSTGATQALYAANLHLEGSPYKPQERLAQARSALASLQKHQTAAGLPPEECHVVVAGDFNSSKGEAVGRLLSSGWLPAGYTEPHLPQVRILPEGGGDAAQPYLLADAYAARPLPFTRKVPQLESSLDWLFVSASLTVTALLQPLDPALPADRRLPHSRTGLPNAAHPSDHLPIGAKLRCLPAGVMMGQQGHGDAS